MRTRKLSAALLAAAAALTSACSQVPSTITTRDAKDIVQHITHVKDSRTEQCFAVVASRHPGEFSQNGFTMTWEPCTALVEAQLEK